MKLNRRINREGGKSGHTKYYFLIPQMLKINVVHVQKLLFKHAVVNNNYLGVLVNCLDHLHLPPRSYRNGKNPLEHIFSFLGKKIALIEMTME